MERRLVLIFAQDEAIATMLHDLLEGELVNLEVVTDGDTEAAETQVGGWDRGHEPGDLLEGDGVKPARAGRETSEDLRLG